MTCLEAKNIVWSFSMVEFNCQLAVLMGGAVCWDISAENLRYIFYVFCEDAS